MHCRPTMGRRVDCRISEDSSRGRLRRRGGDPFIFATALETLAVKAFGDMGQTARLRLIRNRIIAGHSSCELRRYLDSVLPETPIRDVADRCRVWESHADPEVRRISKPSPDPIYLAYVVGDSDNISATKLVVRYGSAGGHASTIAGGSSYPGSGPSSGPSSGSGGASGGEIAAASGGGDTESSAAGREST